MIVTISLLVSAALAVYVYLTWNFSYWKQRNVPGPDPRPLLGNFPSLLLRHRTAMDEMDQMYSDYRAKFNFVGVFNIRQPRIFVTSPALYRDIITKHFRSFSDNEFAELTDVETDPLMGRNPFLLTGEEWQAKRAEISPAFTASRIKALFAIVEELASRMTKYIEQNQHTALEAKDLAAKLTIDVVSSCIFDTDAQSFSEDHGEIPEMARKMLEPSFSSLLIMILRSLCPKIAKALNIGMIPKSVEVFFTNLMKEAIRYRETNSIKRVDYLEHLISLRNKKEITELDMAAHGVTFFFDGFEASSLALSFTLYELGRHPAIQTRLRTELLEATDAKGSIDYDTLLELPFLDQVVNESLRLWPAGPFLSKRCTQPIDLDLTPTQQVRIEPGVCAMIPVWAIHRDPECYTDPDTFNPDRFSPETGGTNPYREMGCFLPFNEGPRQCLGMRFAKMLVKRGLYEVVKNFEFSVDSKTEEPLRMNPKVVLTAVVGGIWLNFEPIITK
ncbi:cytochrome P450 6A1 [Culex quinquefasciatus]|uniref:Cytochrome P450 6A1 n=1 Tax=Culex quinquefasciatus TaxID=7176 RepID=B0XJT6_CULQU|nr:probable cytochrome P450 28d1 [Culex quinquefasciatus]EDS30708.1 cytochrome P450 6A1 [Culex quinquefasciatus]|eukprot:XP_001869908.1 cytochrome P450 6A1 [Culex quinquefasciatus]